MDLKDSEKHGTGISGQKSVRDQDSVSKPRVSGQLKKQKGQESQMRTLKDPGQESHLL